MQEQLDRDDVVSVSFADEREFIRLHEIFVAQRGGCVFLSLTLYEFCMLGEMRMYWETQIMGGGIAGTEKKDKT